MRIIDKGTLDVIISGAGCAGFCAAVQAGRLGLRTAVFDEYGSAGGTMTVMGSNSIDQFNNPFRPVGDRTVISGIGWEFVLKLEKMGFARIPDMDAPYREHSQYGVKVNPVAAAKLMDDLLLEAGVSLFYRQGIVSVDTSEDGTRIESVIVSTKDGLVRHRAKFFIDCTGDGDLCAWAGAEYEISTELQPGTLRLYTDRANAAQADMLAADRLWQKELMRNPEESEALCQGSFGALFDAGGDNTNHVCGLNTADSQSRILAEIRARQSAVRLMTALKDSGSPARIAGAAPECAPRESRRILGDVYMTGEDYLTKRVYDDAVCYTYWFIDIHRAGQAAEIVYLRSEETHTISLGALRPRSLVNVYTAGRCVSADRACSSAIRVKASCMAMGQAAGAAAVVAVRQGAENTRFVDTRRVKDYLKAQGAVVPGMD